MTIWEIIVVAVPMSLLISALFLALTAPRRSKGRFFSEWVSGSASRSASLTFASQALSGVDELKSIDRILLENFDELNARGYACVTALKQWFAVNRESLSRVDQRKISSHLEHIGRIDAALADGLAALAAGDKAADLPDIAEHNRTGVALLISSKFAELADVKELLEKTQPGT